MLYSDQHQKKVTATALLEVNQKLEPMKSYTSHISEAVQKNQKKEDARDTISKSGAFGLFPVGFWDGSGFPIEVEFNFFLTALFGHKSFNHEQF
ncbi:hypothetical protein DN53_05735 [Flagellimonas olearia]|uniref:Uncharacterized protein n=1 Tax=Flagellimonas olearia TaxID=552546 RepID=A0A444VI31_9FLAO|nr:hypothetical protein DN53_05735 [Allomuricauda olearia]